ncbi:Os09g0339100 [Oryza sativa Japonica Group]|uniref:Os09g0339100 protein n=1 Tax=Oryza sativa subsp. japonica TaxID=39947 RepID=Q6ESN6_ORYSJ|nr:hypothetical protein [Oryza sativa Japonica Group]BAF24831.1 Os09g0339100 [Oryza sativa Japonica Group]|eukprot:NP_001062917.1 Os09g0339100 [Oryza sativa Japonica Group]
MCSWDVLINGTSRRRSGAKEATEQPSIHWSVQKRINTLFPGTKKVDAANMLETLRSMGAFRNCRLLGDGLTSELAGRLSSPSRWLFAVSLLLVSAYYLVVGAHFWSPLHNVVGCINCNSSQSTVVSVS